MVMKMSIMKWQRDIEKQYKKGARTIMGTCPGTNWQPAAVP